MNVVCVISNAFFYLKENNENRMIVENLPWCSSIGRRLHTVSLENLT
jgi:hypothetical protein